jgi:hypothetical protein
MKTTLVNQPDITRRNAIKSGIGAVSLAALGTGAAVPAALSARCKSKSISRRQTLACALSRSRACPVRGMARRSPFMVS